MKHCDLELLKGRSWALSRALCTSGLNRFILPQPWHLPLYQHQHGHSTQNICEKHLNIYPPERETGCVKVTMLQWKQSNWPGLCVSCVHPRPPTSKVPMEGRHEEIQDNSTPWFLWIDCITQLSLTMPRALSYQERSITSNARLEWLQSKYTFVDTSLPLSKDRLYPNFSCT